MGVLDVILLKELVDSPETVNTDYVSEAIDISFREGEFSVQLNYENGSSVDMNLHLSVSSDGVNFARIPSSEQNITDDAGTHIWDIGGSGTTYMKVEIDVLGGSIDITKLSYRAKRNH